MNFTIDPETNILYRPILPEQYTHLIISYGKKEGDYAGIGKLKKGLGNRPSYDLIKETWTTDIKKIIEKDRNAWTDKIQGNWGLYFFERDSKNKWLDVIVEVDVDSIKKSKKIDQFRKRGMLEDIANIYLKKRYNLDKETEQTWGNIIHEL